MTNIRAHWFFCRKKNKLISVITQTQRVWLIVLQDLCAEEYTLVHVEITPCLQWSHVIHVIGELNSLRYSKCVCTCKYIYTPHWEITPCLQWPDVIRVWSPLWRLSACDGWTDAAQQVKRRGSQPRGRRATQVQTSSTRRHDPDCALF